MSTVGTVQWTFTTPGDGTTYDMYAIPALDAAGAKLYIGSDSGTFYCLNTSDGSVVWSYPVPTGTDKRIRSGAALDANNPLGSTVYFHCNNGNVYALDANTGAQRWTAATGNAGGPPTAPDPQAPGGNWDPQPVSSSPVVDASGVVYVGSADGSVYSFNRSTGAQNWRVVLNTGTVEPVEATIAIGQDGTLYVATRIQPGTTMGGNIHAINPVTHTKLWTWTPDAVVPHAGFIASPVIDQAGFIYASYFDNALYKVTPANGTTAQAWSLNGKLCQTPSLNQNGLLILGVSAIFQGEVNEVAAIKTTDPSLSTAFWEITQAGGQNLAVSFGSPAIRCTSSGTTYFADALGHVCRFDTGGTMMAGQWPTFQCGNRRAGKTTTYPSAISDLQPFAGSFPSLTSVKSVDALGRAAGQSYGYYKYACGDNVTLGYSAVFWQNNGILNPGGCAFAAANTFAIALNAAGDVCGYDGGPLPLAWPDGAYSGAGSVTLSLSASDGTTYTSGYTSDMDAISTIVGYAFSGPTVHAFRWTKSGGTWPLATTEDLNAPAGGQAYAYAITEDGRIAGKAKFTSGGPFHAFNTDTFPTDLNSDAIDLGTMGGIASEAWDMQDLKGTVGRSQLSTGYWRGFLLPINAPDLGNSAIYEICGLPGVTRTDWNSAAYGVNKLGQVVGYAQNQSLANRAVLYSDLTGTTTDLNNFALDGGQTPASLGWTLTSAVSINDSGVMVGYGSVAGTSTAWIIYPKCQD